MHLLKPYVHLEETGQGDYNLRVVIALHHGLKLGAIQNSVNKITQTREIVISLEKQHAQVYYGPVEVVIPITNSDKTDSGETSIEVKLGDNNNPEPALQLKGSTTVSYGDAIVTSRGGGGSGPDFDTWDGDS